MIAISVVQAAQLTLEVPGKCLKEGQTLRGEVAFQYFFIDEGEKQATQGFSAGVAFSYTAILPFVFFINMSL